MLCRSLQIEPTVTLFRAFQTLYKQGHWFSFVKRRASSPVCIDDNSSAIDDPKLHSQEDVRRLSTHVVKLRDIPDGVLVLSGLSRAWKSQTCDSVLRGSDGNVKGIHDFLCLPEWTGTEIQEEPHHDIRPTLQRLPFYYTLHAAVNAAIPDLTLEDFAAGTSSAKVLAKAEASKKQKASLCGAPSNHVAKRTRSAMAWSSGSTTRLNLFADNSKENDDDEDAWNQSGGSIHFDAEGKVIMTDAAGALSGNASRLWPSSSPVPSFQDLSRDAIHRDFFPFSPDPYYALYPKGGVAGSCEFSRGKWDTPHQPTLNVLNKKVFKDHVVCKTIIDQFPTPREMKKGIMAEGEGSDPCLTGKVAHDLTFLSRHRIELHQAFGTDSLLYINNRSMTAETLGEEYCDITQVFGSYGLPPTPARRALFIVYQSTVPYIAERVMFNSTLLCSEADSARETLYKETKFSGLYKSQEHIKATNGSAVPLEGLHVDDKLRFMEEPVEIMDQEVKRLKQIRILIVKVRWNSRRGPEFTWEREDQFQKKYLHLFTKPVPSSSVAT
ncbi:dual specificity protein phosphatase 1-like protein [Tanacetum coccineum]